MTARDRLRDDMADALRGFRLDCVAIRHDWRVEGELFRAAIAEILALRLEAAYAPLFIGLRRIEQRFAQIAMLAGNNDPYASK